MRMRVIALAISIALGGCSFTFVNAPASTEGAPVTAPRCTDHYVWQSVDGAIALLALGGLLYFAQSDDDFAKVGMVVEGGLALGFGLSAIKGLSKTKRCRAARQAYAQATQQTR